MKDEKKTKAQLSDELAGLRQRISRLEDREGKSRSQEPLQTIVKAIPIPLLITRDRDGQIYMRTNTSDTSSVSQRIICWDVKRSISISIRMSEVKSTIH